MDKDAILEKKDEVAESCEYCGKGLKWGDRAYATTIGIMEKDVDGFAAPDSEPWLGIRCPACQAALTDLLIEIVITSCKQVKDFAAVAKNAGDLLRNSRF